MVMAFGLFLLFVTRQVRQRGDVADKTTYTHPHTHIAYSQHPGGREFQVNTKAIEAIEAAQAAQAAHAPQVSHASAIWMPIALSLMVIGAALAVILLPNYYGDEHQKWAFGIIGLILGFWFKK